MRDGGGALCQRALQEFGTKKKVSISVLGHHPVTVSFPKDKWARVVNKNPDRQCLYIYALYQQALLSVAQRSVI